MDPQDNGIRLAAVHARLIWNLPASLVAHTYGIGLRTLYDWIERYVHTGSVADRPQTGRRRLLNSSQLHHLDDILEEFGCMPTEEIRMRVEDEMDVLLSPRTLRNYLHRLGFDSRLPIVRPWIDDHIRELRYVYCQAALGDAQRDCLFVDECKFELFRRSRRVWVRHGEPRPIQHQPRNPHISIMVWASVHYSGFRQIEVMEGRWNGAMYRDLLEVKLQEVDEEFEDSFTLYQDNSPIHTAHVVQEFLADHLYPVLQGVPYSPCLNPIEKVFGRLKDMVRDTFPTTSAQLRESIIKCFHQIPVEFIHAQIDHLATVKVAIIERNGDSLVRG
jgi:transposase